MNQHPLISIITITFNAADVLPPTMESLAAQSFTDFEHLIVDGASSDDTIGVARRNGTPSLRILSEPDEGLYDAMNKGLRLARGKYVLFLNAGDSLHSPETLSKYAEAAQAEPDIIYSDTVIVNNERQMTGPRHLSAPRLLTRQSFKKGMLICHQAFMVRRSLAPDYNLRYRFSADYDWTIRCIQRTTPQKCVNLGIIGIDYLSDGLTDRNHMKSLRERFTVMANHYGYLTAMFQHLSFIPRAISRKLRNR